MLVNDNIDIDTLEIPPQSHALSWLCKQSYRVLDSQPHCKAILSGREEDEDCLCLKQAVTHYS